MIDKETLVIVMLSAEEYCRHYDIDLLNELKHDQRAKHIVALSSLPLEQAVVLDSPLNDIWLIFPYLVFYSFCHLKLLSIMVYHRITLVRRGSESCC